MSLLMSRENPNGYKLEDLLREIRLEVEAKNAKLGGDDSAAAQRVRVNNGLIIAKLIGAEELQRDTMAVLEQIGPDQGPTGQPRIGA